MTFKRFLPAVSIVAAFCLYAQEPSKSAFSEVFEVRVTNIDVVANDSKGNPITGLTQADFEIYENGKKQEITNFSEVSVAPKAPAVAGEVAAAGSSEPVAAVTPANNPSPRKFIVYVDSGSLSLKNRSDIFEGLRKFLEANLQPGDQAMVASWNRSLSVRAPWTSDRAVLESALKTMAGELEMSSTQLEKQRLMKLLQQLETESYDPSNLISYESLVESARSYADSVRNDVTRSSSALTTLLGSVSGTEGRKVLIMATESLPSHAGSEIFTVLENIRTRAVAAPPPAPGDTPQPGATPTTLYAGARLSTPVGNVSRYTLTSQIEALVRAANAAGVTVYAVNPKGANDNTTQNVELQDAPEMGTAFANSAQALDGVNTLARRTGGRAMIGAPAAMALGRLAQDLSSYYSIGYRTRPGSSPDRKIEVRPKRRGITVTYRTSIYYRSLETEMADRVISNHLQNEVSNDLGITLQASPATTDGGKRLLPVMVVIPVDGLTLLPGAEGSMSGGFSVFTSSADAKGMTPGANVQSQQLAWPAQQAAQMKGRRIAYSVKVPLDKNPTTISIGVIDHVSQARGFARIQVAQ